MGFVTILLQHDTYGTIYGIAVLLGLGMFGSLVRGWKVSKALNRIKDGLSLPISEARKMAHKNEYIRDMAEWCVLIGLLGNVSGLLMALSQGRDALLAASGVALGSTAAGILAALLLGVNNTMIKTATNLLIEDSTE